VAADLPGYSGKPLYAKLGLKDGHRVSLIGAPPAVRAQLVEQANGIAWKRFPTGGLDCIILFAADRRTLESGFAEAAASLVATGMLWLGWPKKASGTATDLTEDRVREYGLARGLVDVKVCAINEVWSGLKFVRRLEDR
jgi:hypothetical protein